MHSAEIDIASAEAERAPAWCILDLVNPAALFLFFRVAGIKYNSVTGFQRRFQLDLYPLALNLRHLAQINASLFAEARMHQFLVVDPANPAAIQASRKRHLHFVVGIWRLVISDWSVGDRSQLIEGTAINTGDVRDILRRFQSTF